VAVVVMGLLAAGVAAFRMEQSAPSKRLINRIANPWQIFYHGAYPCDSRVERRHPDSQRSAVARRASRELTETLTTWARPRGADCRRRQHG
jgi:hypothetical protein